MEQLHCLKMKEHENSLPIITHDFFSGDRRVRGVRRVRGGAAEEDGQGLDGPSSPPQFPVCALYLRLI